MVDVVAVLYTRIVVFGCLKFATKLLDVPETSIIDVLIFSIDSAPVGGRCGKGDLGVGCCACSIADTIPRIPKYTSFFLSHHRISFIL